MSFTDASNGTAVGYSGTIVRTVDGGAIWQRQESGTLEDLRGVSFIDASTGTAVGDGGTILRTTNGGLNWTPQVSGTTDDLYGVSFIDANNGTAVGLFGTILRTMNGGSSWTLQDSGEIVPLRGVSFTDANTGTVVGLDGVILRTTNGGADWDTQVSGTTSSLYCVSFLDANNGIAGGSSGTILKTNDGGTTWNPVPIVTGDDMYGVSFKDINHALMAGENQTAIVFSDALASWTEYPVGNGNLYAASRNAIVGDNGQIFNTPDAGTTWNSQQTGPTTNLRGISFVDPSNGTAVGHKGTLLQTTDGGETWIAQTYYQSEGQINDQLKAVSFFDADNGIAVGSLFLVNSYTPGVPWRSVVLSTTNGGDTWSAVNFNSDWIFNGISYPIATTAYVVGLRRVWDPDTDTYLARAAVLKRESGWTSSVSNTISDPFTDISCTTADICTLVGYGGYIFRTESDMTGWGSQVSGTSNDLHGVHFLDDNNGYIVGNGGIILHTTDAGENWLPQTSNTSENLFSVDFYDADRGAIVGANGLILETTDGGTTWHKIVARANHGFFDVSLAGYNSGFLVGDTGTILRMPTCGNPPEYDCGMLPLEVISFDGFVDGSVINLIWETSAENGRIAHFEVQQRYASTTRSLPQSAYNGWIVMGRVPVGRDTGSRFTYRVAGLDPGHLLFRLKQINLDGTVFFSDEIELILDIDGRFEIAGPYPQPTSDRISFSLTVQQPQPVRLSILDALGRRLYDEIGIELSGNQPARFQIPIRYLASGLYVLHIEGTRFSTNKTFVVQH